MPLTIPPPTSPPRLTSTSALLLGGEEVEQEVMVALLRLHRFNADRPRSLAEAEEWSTRNPFAPIICVKSFEGLSGAVLADRLHRLGHRGRVIWVLPRGELPLNRSGIDMVDAVVTMPFTATDFLSAVHGTGAPPTRP